MAISKELLAKLASGIYDASRLGQIPIVGDLAKEKLADLAKKIDDYFHNYVYQIQKRAEEIMPHESDGNQEFVISNAKHCFEMIDTENLLTGKHYDFRTLAREKTAAYLEKQQHLNEEEKQLLKTYLPPLVEAAIHQLQLRLVEQPEFINEAIGVHHKQIADLNDRVQTVEDRNIPPADPAILVGDISEELKNRWHDYPFLEQQRESGQKELSEFYKLPFGEPKKDGQSDVDIHKLLQETIDSGNDCHERMLVLLGAPGSGKTTVITYLLNKLRIDRPVRVYPLAEFINMNPANWPGELLTRMGLEQKDLCNSVLILDGLDELDLHGQYQKFAEKLRLAWTNNAEITNFTLILTCRTTRLDSNALHCSHVTLAPLSLEQIRNFAVAYLGVCPPDLEACLGEKEDLRDVLGIPLLLYLVLSLNLTIDPDTSMASLYDEIFSMDGDNSIYRRCYDLQEHSITKPLAKQIHIFTQYVATAMFSEKNIREELEEPSYLRLAGKVLNGDFSRKPEDLLIGQFFLFGSKEKKIYFVHRSIFEYFVALSIFNALAELARGPMTPGQLYKEIEPGKSCSLTPLAALLSPHYLSEYPEIKEFLHHIIQKNFHQLSSFGDWAKLMKLFYEYGLADAVPDRPHSGKNGLIEEEYRFLNLLDICRCILLQAQDSPVDLMPEKYHKSSESPYWNLLQQVDAADFSNLVLTGVHLSGVHFVEASLNNADLSHALLSRANLAAADLSGALLSHARLMRTHFSWANLSNTNLSNADLSKSSLYRADLSGADLSGAVLTKSTLPDGRLFEDALAEDGKDVMLQFTNPEYWNELYPGKAVDPHRFEWQLSK